MKFNRCLLKFTRWMLKNYRFLLNVSLTEARAYASRFLNVELLETLEAPPSNP